MKRRLAKIAQQPIESGYEAVKADLNAVVYRLYGLTEKETGEIQSKEGVVRIYPLR